MEHIPDHHKINEEASCDSAGPVFVFADVFYVAHSARSLSETMARRTRLKAYALCLSAGSRWNFIVQAIGSL
jgi:hypothetical protein